MISGLCDTENWSNYAENDTKIIFWKANVLNSNNFTLLLFYSIFDQSNET